MSANKDTGGETVYYLPVTEPNILLEGCETLLKNLIGRIIEKHLNGHTNYSNEAHIKRVKVTKLVIDFTEQNM